MLRALLSAALPAQPTAHQGSPPSVCTAQTHPCTTRSTLSSPALVFASALSNRSPYRPGCEKIKPHRSSSPLSKQLTTPDLTLWLPQRDVEALCVGVNAYQQIIRERVSVYPCTKEYYSTINRNKDLEHATI